METNTLFSKKDQTIRSNNQYTIYQIELKRLNIDANKTNPRFWFNVDPEPEAAVRELVGATLVVVVKA